MSSHRTCGGQGTKHFDMSAVPGGKSRRCLTLILVEVAQAMALIALGLGDFYTHSSGRGGPTCFRCRTMKALLTGFYYEVHLTSKHHRENDSVALGNSNAKSPAKRRVLSVFYLTTVRIVVLPCASSKRVPPSARHVQRAIYKRFTGCTQTTSTMCSRET